MDVSNAESLVDPEEDDGRGKTGMREGTSRLLTGGPVTLSVMSILCEESLDNKVGSSCLAWVVTAPPDCGDPAAAFTLANSWSLTVLLIDIMICGKVVSAAESLSMPAGGVAAVAIAEAIEAAIDGGSSICSATTPDASGLKEGKNNGVESDWRCCWLSADDEVLEPPLALAFTSSLCAASNLSTTLALSEATHRGATGPSSAALSSSHRERALGMVVDSDASSTGLVVD